MGPGDQESGRVRGLMYRMQVARRRPGGDVGARNAGMHGVILDPFGDYAEPHQLAIRRPEELPALLASRFTLVSSRPGNRVTPS